MPQNYIAKMFRMGALSGILISIGCANALRNYEYLCTSHALNPGILYNDWSDREDPVSCQSFSDGTILCEHGDDIATVSSNGKLSYFSEGQEKYIIAEGPSVRQRIESGTKIIPRTDDRAKKVEKKHWDTVIAMHGCHDPNTPIK